MNKPDVKTVAVVASLARSLINFRGPLLKSLTDRGYRVIAFAPYDADVESRLREMGIAFRPVPMQRNGLNPLADAKFVRRLYQEFIRVRPHIIFSYTIKPVLYGTIAAWLAKIPKISVMITGLGYIYTGKSLKRTLVSSLVTPLYRFALRRAHLILFQNTDDRNYFLEKKIVCDRARIAVVSGSGVDLKHYSPRPLPSHIAFLMIARLVKDKGVAEYIDAAERLQRMHPDVKCLLCGPLDTNPSAIRRAELEAWISRGAIEYLGELKDVRPAIERASVYVLPSYREGMPRTVLEAMSMQRAVITTDTPGCRDTIVDGVSGWLVPPRDADALLAAMKKFVDNPASAVHMSRAARSRAEQLFGVEQVNSVVIDHIEHCYTARQ